ncbi:hypothetical protein BC832DRAFT_595639 [Gaertneriomyces semiglobifer]|nr:hypothetical protein BC832DRAFT_595639 [Gaertneriomyces semiglobifer]
MPEDIERQRIDRAREVTAALKEGKMPTTAQAVGGIEKVEREATLAEVSQDMSSTGKKVLIDTERLLHDTKKVMAQTMPNNELQNALYYGGRAASSTSGSQADLSGAADQLVQAGAKAAQLTKIIITSPEFRTLLNDMSAIAQDILRTNTIEASDELANDPNAPDQVKQAAARTRDTIQTKGPEGATREGQAQMQATAQEGRQRLEEEKQRAAQEYNVRSQQAQETGRATQRTAGDSLAGGASLRDTTKNIVDVVADRAEQYLPNEVVDRTSGAIREQGAKLHTGEVSTQDYKQQGVAKKNELMNQGRAAMDSATAQLRDPNSQVRQTGERVARKLADLPEERRQEIITRIRNVARTIQSKPEFQSGISELFDIVAPLAWQAKESAATTLNKAAEAPTDPNQIQASRDARIAISNAKQLLENFARGRPLDPLIETIRDFAAQARDDEALRLYWRDLGNFLQRIIKETGYADNTNFNAEARSFIDRGRQVMDQYSYYTQNLSYEAGIFTSALSSNKATQKVQADANTLINDLFLDERGKPTFKPELLRDLAKAIPKIADKLAYLPIPRIDVDDGTYHVVFDNIILHSTILPKYVRIVTDTTVDATKSDPNEQLNNFLLLEISKIEASARDIAWLVNKHSGLMKVGDVGLADFDIKGEGLSIRLKVIPGSETGVAAPSSNVQGRFLHAADVKTTLHNLDLRLHDSRHDFLYKLAKPILQSRAKKQIEKAINDAIADLIFALDEKVVQASTAMSTTEPALAKGVPEWGSKSFTPAKEV